MRFAILLLPLMLVTCGGIRDISPAQQFATEQQLPPIDPRGGQLCAFRVSNFSGAAITYDLRANDEPIGRLSNNSYFCVNLLPKEYVISGDSSYWGARRVGTETIIRQGERRFIELQVGASPILSTQTREIGLAGIHSTK